MKLTLAAMMLGLAAATAAGRPHVRSSALRRAIPANRDGTVRRQLNDQNGGGEQGEIQLTSDQSIMFYHCVSLTVYDEEIYDSYYLSSQVKDGKVIPQQSFVLFQVLDKDDGSSSSSSSSSDNYQANQAAANNNYQANNKYAANAGYYQNNNQYNNNGGYSSSSSSSSSAAASFDDSNLYMLPLQDWMEATGELEQQKEEQDERYCEMCLESVNTCKALGYSPYGGNYNNNGNRALQAITGQGQVRRLENGQCYENVDCGTCISNGCFQQNWEENDNNNNGNDNGYWKDGSWVYYCQEPEQQQNENGNYNNYQAAQYNSDCEYSEEQVEEFVGEAACFETGIMEYSGYGDELNLKAGLMCSSDGKGVAMAIFLDEECSLYDKSRTFKDTVGEDSYYYGLANSAYSLMVTPMKEAVSCSNCEYAAVGYDGYEEAQEQQQQQQNNYYYNQQQGEEEQEEEVSEFCRRVSEESQDLVTCRGEMYNRYNNYQQNNYENNNNGEGQNNQYQNFQYDYDLAEGEDEAAACLVVSDAKGDYSNYHVFSAPKSSSNGVDGTNNVAWNSFNIDVKDEKVRKIAGIVSLVVLFLVGAMIGFCCCGKKRAANSKAEPLVDASEPPTTEGTMA